MDNIINPYRGAYTPAFLPGSVSRDRPDIARPAPTSRSTSLSVIESRINMIRRESKVLNLDPMLKRFFDTDLLAIMAIARAADRWAYATNAEISRQAAGQIQAAVRAIPHG